MRHLQLCTRPQSRGAEIFATQLAGEFTRRGHTASIGYLYKAPDIGSLGLRRGDFALDADSTSWFEKAPGFQFSILSGLREEISKFRPHIIQLNGARAVKYGALLRYTGVRTPIVYRSIGDPRAWSRGGIKQNLYGRLIVSRMDAIVAVSNATRISLEQCYRPRAPITVIPRGIDLKGLRSMAKEGASARLREKHGIGKSALVAVQVGSLSPEKRSRWLVETLEPLLRAGSLQLWFVGDGEDRSSLQDLLRERDLRDSVSLLGHQDQVAEYLQAADLLVLASSTEGSPGVVLEAGALGRPCVATRVGGVPELVRDGQTGLLAERHDAPGFRSAVQRLRDQPQQRIAMGREARRLVEESFSIEHIASRLEQFYTPLLPRTSAIHEA